MREGGGGSSQREGGVCLIMRNRVLLYPLETQREGRRREAVAGGLGGYRGTAVGGTVPLPQKTQDTAFRVSPTPPGMQTRTKRTSSALRINTLRKCDSFTASQLWTRHMLCNMLSSMLRRVDPECSPYESWNSLD